MATNSMTTRTRGATAAATALVLALWLAVGTSAHARDLQLSERPDAGEGEHWMWHEIVDDDVMASFQEVVGAPAEPIAEPPAEPVRIAVVYPSHDVSDFWLRNYLAMVARLEELGIPHETTQYASGMGDHELQATYTDQVLQNADEFDYVIFGPTELSLQADNVKRLIDEEGLETIVWNYDLALKDWGDEQPLGYVAFSHLAGALNMCDWVVDALGTEGTFALVRGTPGSIDDQRSMGFAECLMERSDWEMAYEHYGNFLREGGYDGTQLITSAYPDVTLIHNANTAMAMGSLSSILGLGLEDRIAVTAWGGTGDELEALRLGELAATPMRMGDDVGVATAELIKYHLEGRIDEAPLVFVGRITIVHRDMDVEEIDAMEKEAFRYTGVGTLER
jgi:autoinducer 2-binding periplasmic protein LuxP